MNVISITGRLARDIELREAGESTVTDFTVAVSGNYNRDKTNWVRCTAWNKTAEIMEKYLSKGSQVGITGELLTDTYEKDGEKRTSVKVNVNSLDFLDSKDDNSEGKKESKADDEEFPF